MQNRRYLFLALMAVFGFLLYDAWQKDHQPPQVVIGLPTTGVVSFNTDLFSGAVRLQDGALVHLELKQYPESDTARQRHYQLLSENSLVLQPRYLVGGQPLVGAFAASAPVVQGKTTTLTLTHAQMQLIYTFTEGSYVVQLKQRYQNSQAAPQEITPFVRLHHLAKPKAHSLFSQSTFEGVGSYQWEEGQYSFAKKAYTDVAGGESLEKIQTGGWITGLRHYFVTALIPEAKEKVVLSAKPAQEQGQLVQLVYDTQKVAANQISEKNTTLYLGPKLQGKLDEVAPGLALTEDYGLLTSIAKPLFWLLKAFHQVFGNWGVAIILLTLLVKAAFFKLSEAQYRSMAKMKVFAPRIQEIRDRFADDRAKLNEAMMDLYKKEKFNPLAGCWPMLLQMPVFFALFWVLQESVELRMAPFVGWITDLSAPDRFYLLPILFGISMFAQQKLSGNVAADPMQQRIMNLMPLMMTVFFLNFPSGLVLYWFTSNVIGIAQQWLITKRMEAKPV